MFKLRIALSALVVILLSPIVLAQTAPVLLGAGPSTGEVAFG
jgi:hypothetical protein